MVSYATSLKNVFVHMHTLISHYSKTLTDHVNNIDYLVIMPAVKGGDRVGSKRAVSS